MFARRKRTASGDLSASEFLDRNELDRILSLWVVPETTAIFDQRIARTFHSYRQSPLVPPTYIAIASPPVPPTTTEVYMKRCNAGDERSEVGGRRSEVGSQTEEIRLAEISRDTGREFRLTIIDNASLLERLAREFRFVSGQLRLAWPAFKRDPIGVGKRALAESGKRLRQALATPHALAAVVTAMLVVISAVMVLVLVGNASDGNNLALAGQDKEVAEIVEFLPTADATPEGHGVGVGSNGRVGVADGRGEGSAAEPKKSRGGGGGGDHHQLPAQVGKLPPPSEIPAPIPAVPTARNPALPVAGIDFDPALWKNLPMAVYGDPRSNSSAPSNGPGDGGGMGTGGGQGVGEGSRSGFGPGADGNTGGGTKDPGCCRSGGSQGNNPDDPDRVYPVQQVNERARVLMKPEPQYTEEARRNAITGSVVLRVVFSRTGDVTNIRAVQSLPFGLTERAIAAARLIRFRPATRNGQAVNVSMQLEYNFNLY